uniref:Calponin-homology (CH) domain-containing protein n=1 Tax=Ciona intestinalis TaxID=7719 RepID=H2Y3A6_CIOIN
RKMFTAMDNSSNKSTGGKKVGRSPTFVVPNANNVKQMLLKWCQAKTRGYDHVDINNFSGSWASGMAFCALVHNFFPEAYDYSTLDPKARAKNFTLAFDAAERLGEIPPLLDPEDMIRMAEPDWKCVYTYIMEFYKRI